MERAGAAALGHPARAESDAFEPHGPFAIGTTLTVTPRGQEAMRWTIVELVPGTTYVDRTAFGDLELTFRHDLDTAHPDASSSPGLALWRASSAWQRRIRAALAPHDLTHVQYVLLASLTWMDRTEPVSQKDLARHAALDVMMTSQVLRTLEARGRVRREPHPGDGRAIAVHPTPQGVELAIAATRDVEAADAAYFAALTTAQRTSMLAALQRLAASTSD